MRAFLLRFCDLCFAPFARRLCFVFSSFARKFVFCHVREDVLRFASSLLKSQDSVYLIPASEKDSCCENSDRSILVAGSTLKDLNFRQIETFFRSITRIPIVHVMKSGDNE